MPRPRALSAENAAYSAATVVLVALLTLGLLAVLAFESVERHDRATNRSHVVLLQLTRLATELAQVERLGSSANALAGLPTPALATTKQNAWSAIAELRRLIAADSQWHPQLARLSELVEAYPGGSSAYAGRPGVGGATTAADSGPRLPAALGDALDLVDRLARSQIDELRVDLAAEHESFVRLRDTALVTGVTAGLLIGLMFLLIRRDLAARRAAAAALAAAIDKLQGKARERTAELASASTKLRGLSNQLETTLEEERLRIARELHDDLGSTLTALKLELSGSPEAHGGTTRGRARRASVDLVDSALNVLQNVVAELRPSALDRFGVWEAIRWKLRQFEEMMKIGCHVDMPDDLPQPPDQVAIAIFRVVEEALTNVARHAGAHTVRLQVRSTERDLEIAIADDGRGISGQQIVCTQSYGLLGMHERARRLAGSFHVSRGPLGGTTACLQVPLSRLHAWIEA